MVEHDSTTSFLIGLVNDDFWFTETNELNIQLVEKFQQFMFGEITHEELVKFSEDTNRTDLLDTLKVLLWGRHILVS